VGRRGKRLLETVLGRQCTALHSDAVEAREEGCRSSTRRVPLWPSDVLAALASIPSVSGTLLKSLRRALGQPSIAIAAAITVIPAAVSVPFVTAARTYALPTPTSPPIQSLSSGPSLAHS